YLTCRPQNTAKSPRRTTATTTTLLPAPIPPVMATLTGLRSFFGDVLSSRLRLRLRVGLRLGGRKRLRFFFRTLQDLEASCLGLRCKLRLRGWKRLRLLFRTLQDLEASCLGFGGLRLECCGGRALGEDFFRQAEVRRQLCAAVAA